MEFFQFHPTGIYKMGILITEGVRGEGGVLVNSEGDRFMDRYAPTIKDLASRDVVSRAIYLEVRDGRGIDGKDYVHLDVRPETVNRFFERDGIKDTDGTPRRISAADIEAKLPDIADFTRTYLGVDPTTQPMPVQPTAHYAMGGIPTDMWARVVLDENNTVMPGFYAAGEVACVSVHGANRLGTNSLLDIVVFGKRAGLDIVRYCQENDFLPLPKEPEVFARDQLETLLADKKGGERAADIRRDMQDAMMDYVSVFREEAGMKQAIDTIRDLQQRFQHINIDDKGTRFNTDVLEAWELEALLDIAQVTAVAALDRAESRGGHYREDFPKRDDENWLKHSLAWQKDGNIELSHKAVTVTDYEPMERVY
jgi:succinate dehydrogenase / fumarate reductase flavoprotein subunit